MTMEELVLAKLVELARNPTRAELYKSEQVKAALHETISRQDEELASYRQAEAANYELFKAAEAMIKADPAKVSVAERGKMRVRLGKALVAAERFVVDEIPF